MPYVLDQAGSAYGPFASVVSDGVALHCMGPGADVVLPLSVIGPYTLSDTYSPTPVAVVPSQVTRRQAKQALALAGLLSSVQPAIDAIADATQRQLMQIEWDDSQDFVRNRPTLIQLAKGALGMTDAQIDALFVQAAKL